MENWAHKQTEESLEKREQLLRLILENAPVGILTVDPDGEIHSVNPYLCKMLGYSSEEFLAMEFDDVVHPDDQGDDTSTDQLLAGEISHFDVEARLIRKDGGVITADIHVNLVRDAQGQPQLLVGQVQDITARKKAEEDRHRRGELLRMTFDNAPIGMAITGLDRSIIRCNTALATMLGYTRAELESLSALETTHPDDRQETARYLHSMWQGAVDHQSVEKRYLRKDGSAVTCQSHVSVVSDDNGKPLMVIAQVEDITERLQATRDMQRMRTHLKNMIDSMPSMLVAVDKEGVVTQWNSVAQQTTGLAAKEAIGQVAGDLLPLNDAQGAQIAQAISSGRPVKAERLSITLKGQNRIVDALAYPLFSDDEVAGAVIRLDDVTEQVRMQEMMVQTEKMLSVGGLAAGMAHEINNPLGAILQSCQNIQRRLSEDLPANQTAAGELGLDLGVVHQYMEARKVLQFLERIQEAGSRAAKIVRDMLTFSRRSELHYEPIDLKELLHAALRLASSDFDLSTNYDIKQVEFVSDFDPELGPVECDKTEIEQVILNLIVNAAHAMAKHPDEDKPPQITLRTRRDGEYARIEVIDNGPGMDEETRRRLFEPFYTTKEVGVGTGLGLSVSYFIIYDQHKGSMQVVSAPGDGAKFIIRLPLRQG